MVWVRILNALALCCVLMVGAALPQHSAPARASVATAPRLGPGLVLPGSTTSLALAGKYPRITAFGHFLYMISNTGRQANYWSMSDTASSASPPALLGATDGDTEHADATIAAAPDGTLYAAWIFNQTAVIVRRKPVNRAWESGSVIYWSANYLSYVDIAVAGDGQIFVVWKEDDLYRYARSSDGGAGWPDAGIVSSKTAYKPISITGGAGGTIVAAFGGGDGHAYASIWNGSKFLTSDLTPFASESDFFAFAEPAVAPNGKIYIAFSNGKLNPGLYYSERQPDGSWPISHLTDGRVYGAIGFSADAENNLHIAWASDKSGQWELYYAFKPDSGDWQDMIRAPRTTGDLMANVNATATIGARAYGHMIFETFDGANGALRYQQFSSDLASPDATPVLDGGARLTRNTLVTLGFTNVIGSPDSMRYRWDAPPTAADPWLPFANPLTIAVPPGLREDTCTTHVLYTQVRKGSREEPTPGQATQVFDIGVQAQVQALNPNMASLPSSDVISLADTAESGARDGDPRYTRERQFFLNINGQVDCAHLKEFVVAGGSPVPIGGSDRYNRRFALPGDAAPGDKSFDVQLSDWLGNQKTWPFTLTYDPANTDTTGTLANSEGLPVLGQGGSFGADDANSIIRSLSFQDISVTDNLFGQKEQLPPGKQFWGLWIANATADVGPDSPALNWYPVRVPAPDSSFTVTWDLFSGLGYTSDLSNKPGDYFVYVRFLAWRRKPHAQGALEGPWCAAAGLYARSHVWLSPGSAD